MLDKIKNKRMFCLLSNSEYLLNKIIGIIKIIMSIERKGDKYDNEIFIDSNITKLLLKSLIASLKGCKVPNIPTLFGPFRIWIYLNIFRSKIVKKATLIRILIEIIMKFNENRIII